MFVALQTFMHSYIKDMRIEIRTHTQTRKTVMTSSKFFIFFFFYIHFSLFFSFKFLPLDVFFWCIYSMSSTKLTRKCSGMRCVRAYSRGKNGRLFSLLDKAIKFISLCISICVVYAIRQPNTTFSTSRK